MARELGLPPERTNPNRGGISLGHPTGAILVVKLRPCMNCAGPTAGAYSSRCASAEERA
jgi:hypothetical protein